MVKDFNIKQSSATAWLRREEFDNGKTFDIAFDYAIGCFDAADSVDLNAAKAVCMRPDDPNIYVYSMYWIPQSVLDADEAAGNRREREMCIRDRFKDNGCLIPYPSENRLTFKKRINGVGVWCYRLKANIEMHNSEGEFPSYLQEGIPDVPE